jgi:hypothetical protein
LSGYYPFTSSTAAAQNLPLQQQQHSRHLSQPQTGFRQPPPSGFYPPQQSHPGPGEWYSLQQGLPSPIGPQRPGGRQPSFDPQQGQQRGFGGPAPALMASANAFVPQGQQMRPPQGHPFYLPPQQLQQHQQQYPSFYPQPPQYNLQHHQRQLSSPTTSTTSPSGASSNLVASPLTPTTSVSPPSLTELGKGLPLSSVPLSTTLYIVEFKGKLFPLLGFLPIQSLRRLTSPFASPSHNSTQSRPNRPLLLSRRYPLARQRRPRHRRSRPGKRPRQGRQRLHHHRGGSRVPGGSGGTAQDPADGRVGAWGWRRRKGEGDHAEEDLLQGAAPGRSVRGSLSIRFISRVWSLSDHR